MAELAQSIKGQMIISVNDIAEMREAFAGMRMETVEIGYTAGGMQRAKNKSRELIIKNLS